MSKPSKVFGSWLDRPAFHNSDNDKGEAEAQKVEETRKESLRQRINALYGIGDPQAAEQMQAEQTKLADATRGYYTDQLGRSYTKAERDTRFKLARQGQLGGSEDLFQQGEVQSDRDLGATRVDEAVRRAIAGLTGQREQERLNAVNLVNAGHGDSAVSAAQAGLRTTLDNAASEKKADLFNDLFVNAADAGTASNLNAQNALLAARYRDRLSSFFPPSGTTSGRVTPSA